MRKPGVRELVQPVHGQAASVWQSLVSSQLILNSGAHVLTIALYFLLLVTRWRERAGTLQSSVTAFGLHTIYFVGLIFETYHRQIQTCL